MQGLSNCFLQKNMEWAALNFMLAWACLVSGPVGYLLVLYWETFDYVKVIFHFVRLIH